MAQQNSNGVAEAFDVFGNKVSGTSVKVHARPGGNTSIDLFGGYGGNDNVQDRQRNRNATASGAPGAEEEKKQEQQQPAAAQAAAVQQPAAAQGNSMQGV